MKRFNKSKLINDLLIRANDIQRKNGFDFNDGTAQLEKSGIGRAVEYGRYICIIQIIEEIEGRYLGI